MAKKAKSIRLEEALHNRATGAGKARGLGVEETYTEALTKWLDDLGDTTSDGISSGISHDIDNGGIKKQELPWVTRLLKVLRSGNRQNIDAIQWMLGLAAPGAEEGDESSIPNAPAPDAGISHGTKDFIERKEAAVRGQAGVIFPAGGGEKPGKTGKSKTG